MIHDRIVVGICISILLILSQDVYGVDVINEWVYAKSEVDRVPDQVNDTSNYLSYIKKSLEVLLKEEPVLDTFAETVVMGEFESDQEYKKRIDESVIKANNKYNIAKTDWVSRTNKCMKSMKEMETLYIQACKDFEIIKNNKSTVLQRINYDGMTTAVPVIYVIISSTIQLPFFDRETMSFRNISLAGLRKEEAIDNNNLLKKMTLSGETSFDIKVENLKMAEQFKQLWAQGKVRIAIRAVPSFISRESPIVIEQARTEKRPDYMMLSAKVIGALAVYHFGGDPNSIGNSIPPDIMVQIPAKTRPGERWHFDLRIIEASLVTANNDKLSGISVIAHQL